MMPTLTPNPARQLCRVSKLPIVKLAAMVGVSRQAYHKWLKGKTITESHMAALTQLLEKYPPEETITIEYEVHSISFTCRCGAALTLKRRTGSMASGIFCDQCKEHHWINWQEGILRNGRG